MKEIIKVMDEGTQDRVEHGAVIEIQGDNINIECLNIMPVDIVRIAIGILEVVHEMGMDEVLKQMYSYCFEDGGEVQMAEQKNCRLTIEVKDGKVLTEAEFVDMVDLATMCGALQLLMGLEAVSRGKSLEDVKDNMLDIHLAAMETLTDQVIKERGSECGS